MLPNCTQIFPYQTTLIAHRVGIVQKQQIPEYKEMRYLTLHKVSLFERVQCGVVYVNIIISDYGPLMPPIDDNVLTIHGSSGLKVKFNYEVDVSLIF